MQATERTIVVMRRLFRQADHRVVEDLLVRECGANLALTDLWGEAQFERLWLAAMKLSAGDVARLRKEIALAQTDWRDVLMAAGFGTSLEAHRQWADSLKT